MLDWVLSRMPSGKDKGKNREAELHTLHIQTGGIVTSPEEDSREGEAKASSPRGKKRAASEDLETEIPKQGKKGITRGLCPDGHPHRVMLANGPALNRAVSLIVNSKVLRFS